MELINTKLFLVIFYKINVYGFPAELKINGIYPSLEIAEKKQLELLHNNIINKTKIENNFEIKYGKNNIISWIKESKLGETGSLDLRPGY